ncbi:MAG: hypothetical protein KBS59_00335 [Clostridiales bacterium]|nr:hypothetical protein [Clostridiales bacterium]
MPSGYAGEGKTFSKLQGKWIKKSKEKTFDYDTLTEEQQRSAALIISFFRYYPDLWYDMIRSKNAKYKIELPQRLFLRVWARYRNTYTTGSRGIAKSYTLQLGKDHDGIFFPGEKIRYVAPAQKQSAKIASDAFKTVEENYPLMASWWNKNNDRADMFRITTPYNSEFTMYAPRGDNCAAIVGEEIAAEGEDGFDIETFEADISPTCRLTRKIHGITDRAHINLKETYISNASSRQNRAFTVYRHNALKDMLYGDKYDGFCMDISWISSLLCNIRDIAYFKKERKKLTQEAWLREMCVRYTGTGENPLIDDETLAKSKQLMVMEERHCGDPNAIYVVSHDVSYAGGNRNAECADIILKLTPFKSVHKRDKYRKQVVYADSYPPPPTSYLQAQKLRHLWERYSMDGGNTTYIVVDSWQYGQEVCEELIKPTNDGSPNLCCINHMKFTEIEQPNALPVIYPLKAGTRGVTDSDGEMIQYAQLEFQQGNVELLTGNILDGIEAYKVFHRIKDNYTDRKIKLPYDKTDQLCQQISNLKAEVSGLTLKEKRKSHAIQRDLWSALKYALRMAQLLEADLKKEQYRAKSSWSDVIEQYTSVGVHGVSTNNTRANLLKMRHR